jgi:hypothetical protein
MSNYSALKLNRDCPSPKYDLKLILKIPKRYLLGKILISLVRLTQIQMTFLGELTGQKSDRFNWFYVQMNGTVIDLVNASLYLEILQIDIDVVKFDPDSLIHFINYYCRD